MTITEAPSIDPVTLEVIKSVFPAISNEMSYDLQRTSYNMMIYEVRDYCCAVLDTKGQLLAQNMGGVSHFIADLGVVIKNGLEVYGENGFSPGDVILMNHQAVCGQHLNNVVVYIPFFFEGKLTAFPTVRAHWVDIGGLSTGFGAGPAAFDPWCEGLQFDQLKIYEAGELDQKLMKMIRDNVRFPEAAIGDLRAQIAACRLAERRLEEIYTRYGAETIDAAMKMIFDQSERRCRAIVEQIPDGVYEAESTYDGQGAGGSGVPIKVHAKVTIAGSDMEIDLSGCAPQQNSSQNSRTLAAAYIAYKALTTPSAPANEGSFAALKAVIPEGNIMMAQFPAAMSSWANILSLVVDTILKSLASAIPDRIPAGHIGYQSVGRSFMGHDPNRGRRFVMQSIDGGGWGGRPTEDGPSGSVTVCQGDVRNTPIESVELKAPVIFEHRELRQDSGGPGQFRGGLGMSLRVRGLVDGRWGISRDLRTICPPWGLQGGFPGRNGTNRVKSPNDTEFQETELLRFPAVAETIVRGETAGGGGWGNPLHREVDRVLEDVLNGYVSIEGARDDYGVVIATDLTVDEEQTKALRERLLGEILAATPTA